MKLSAENLPKTDVTAELTFPDKDAAQAFAVAYSRKTLMGHSIGGSTVKIWNVTGDLKVWIDDYIKANF